MNDQLDLFAPPKSVTRPATTVLDPTIIEDIFTDLKREAQTADDVAARTGIPLAMAVKAVRALHEADRIEDSQERKQTPRYTHGIVWRVKP